MKNSPIGIFDSGIGGLSVFSRLINLLPNENYIYFGDTKNLPYGEKSKEELLEISSNIFDFFQSKKVKAVVMACNTTSAAVYDDLKSNYDFEIYPIVQCISKYIANENYKRIGVFATTATVNSHAYKKEIETYSNNTIVYETSCPMWVNIVENSLLNEEKSIDDIKKSLKLMLKNDVEKIILGCTHYPYLLDILTKYAPKDLFIDPAIQFAKIIANDLKNKNLINNEIPTAPQFFASSNAKQFEKSSDLFYKVDNVKEIYLSNLLES